MHKNLKRRKVQNYNRTKPFCQWITTSFTRKPYYNAITLTWHKTVFIKKTLIFSKTVDKIHIKML